MELSVTVDYDDVKSADSVLCSRDQLRSGGCALNIARSLSISNARSIIAGSEEGTRASGQAKVTVRTSGCPFIPESIKIHICISSTAVAWLHIKEAAQYQLPLPCRNHVDHLFLDTADGQTHA
jgi:hypothetical protein